MKRWTLTVTIIALIGFAVETLSTERCNFEKESMTLSLYVSTGEGKSINSRNCSLTLYTTPGKGKRLKGVAVRVNGFYQLAGKGRVFLAVTARFNEGSDRQSYKLRIDTDSNGEGPINTAATLIPEDNPFSCGEPASLDIGIYGLARRIRYDQQETVLNAQAISLKPIFENCENNYSPE